MQDEAGAIALLKAGHVAGLETLVHLYQRRALRTAYAICGDRQIAEDVVSDAFLSAYRYIGTYDGSRPFLPWFYRIVVRNARAAMGRRSGLQTIGDGRALLVDQRDPDPGPESEAVRGEVRSGIIRQVESLPLKQREVIVLRYYLDMDERAMATTLGVPIGTVKWRLHRARERLQGHIAAAQELSNHGYAEGELT